MESKDKDGEKDKNKHSVGESGKLRWLHKSPNQLLVGVGVFRT